MSSRALAFVACCSLLAGCGKSDGDSQDYNPIVLGRYADFDVSVAGGAPSSQRSQIVAASASGYSRRSTTAGTAGYTQSEFVFVNGSEYGQATTVHGADGSVIATMTYAPPFAYRSADDTPGHAETTVSTVTAGTATYQNTRTVTVDGTETVTVPAGTFNALKTTAHITDSNGFDGYNVNWWVPGMGRVKIMNYPASSPSSGTTYLMTGSGVAAIP